MSQMHWACLFLVAVYYCVGLDQELIFICSQIRSFPGVPCSFHCKCIVSLCCRVLLRPLTKQAGTVSALAVFQGWVMLSMELSRVLLWTYRVAGKPSACQSCINAKPLLQGCSDRTVKGRICCSVIPVCCACIPVEKYAAYLNIL